MSEPRAMPGAVRRISVREATVAAGFEVLARTDFGAGIAFYVARALDGGPAREALIRIVAGPGERETGAAARLGEHPNLLRPVEVRRAPGYRVLVFEPFAGRSLEREVERAGRLDVRRAADVAAGAARALAHAHARGVVHGDVAAGNIALGSRGEVKLVGFGATAEAGSPEGDLARLGRTIWRAVASGPAAGEARDDGASPSAVRPSERVAPLARVLERCMRLRPEIGFYPDARAATAALEAAARRAGEARADMAGRFEPADLSALLQMVALCGRSGRLEIRPAGGAPPGAIAFRDGRIVAARAGAETGPEAALKLLAVAEGRFRMWFGPVPAVPAGDGRAIPIALALLEASRRRDEARTSSNFVM